MENTEQPPLPAEKLEEILKSHRLWIDGDPKGIQANLSGANLSGANLSGANLTGATLSRAYGAPRSWPTNYNPTAAGWTA